MSHDDPNDYFTTVADGPEIEDKVKASRFLGQVFFVNDVEEAEAVLLRVKKRYHDARHHCYAWRLGTPEAPLSRSDDDGEPSSTAGPPILAVLTGSGVLNTLCVVTRYFGGTKLGKGGLIRAYGDAARAALDAAPRRIIWRDEPLEIEVDYRDLGAVEATLPSLMTVVTDVKRVFHERPRFLLTVRRSAVNAVRAALIEATSARVSFPE